MITLSLTACGQPQTDVTCTVQASGVLEDLFLGCCSLIVSEFSVIAGISVAGWHMAVASLLLNILIYFIYLLHVVI